MHDACRIPLQAQAFAPSGSPSETAAFAEARLSARSDARCRVQLFAESLYEPAFQSLTCRDHQPYILGFTCLVDPRFNFRPIFRRLIESVNENQNLLQFEDFGQQVQCVRIFLICVGFF